MPQDTIINQEQYEMRANKNKFVQAIRSLVRTTHHCPRVGMFLMLGMGSAYAAHRLDLNVKAKFHPVSVGQQQSGQPVRLHGVIESISPDNHRVKISHLEPLEIFWGETMQDIAVDQAIRLEAFEPGVPVIAVLARRFDGRYYVTKLARG